MLFLRQIRFRLITCFCRRLKTKRDIPVFEDNLKTSLKVFSSGQMLLVIDNI